MLTNFWLSNWMLWVRHTAWRSLTKASVQPEAIQARVLRRIVHENRATRFGREHEFERIASYQDFAQAVPVASYEALRPYIEAQLRTGEPALTTAAPVLYAKTSGTTAEPKYVPLIQEELRGQKLHTALLTSRQYDYDRLAFAGKLWVMAAAAEEGKLANNVPFGSASGFLYANMAKAIAEKYLVPAEVFNIQDSDLKYRMVLRLALAEKNVSYVSTANPTTLSRLCALANAYGPELASDIEQGKVSCEADLSPEVARALRQRVCANPGRARELREIFGRNQPATLADLWPSLRLVSTWMGGNCAVAAQAVRRLLPASTRMVELGYLSSEFRGTLTVDCESGAGLPTLQDHFFEFIEPRHWEEGGTNYRLLQELETGRDYYVIVTTPSGLYRYFINDIIRVVGRFGMTPTLQFVQKGRGVTNITGEKLYESHVFEAIGITAKRLGIQADFFLALADVEDQSYRLYLELDSAAESAATIADNIDRALAELNDEYRTKRESGRLKPLRALLLKQGTGEAYRAHCIGLGQKEGQFKAITLQYAEQCQFPFQPHLRGE